MKTLRIVFYILISVMLVNCADSNLDSLNIENEVVSKTFHFSTDLPDQILVEIFSKEAKQLISDKKGIPVFEFVIDNQLVSSFDKYWVFKSQVRRVMGNGGEEFTYIFEGKKSPVNGLQVHIYQQIFPNSTLIREKLLLKTANESFVLNKMDGKLHFRFPSYSINNEKSKPANSTEIRIASYEKKPITFGDKEKGNHMYYPDYIETEVDKKEQVVKGPISIISNKDLSWFTAYEHASQDNLNGLFNEEKLGEGNLINDAMQGTKGVFNFPIKEEDFKFLGIASKSLKKRIDISVDILRGGYLDGEEINKVHSYSTVWTASGFYTGNNPEDGKKIIRNYLLNQICEKPASRIPEFYYNTWGLQRNDKTKPLRDILTYERIFEEIEYAAELGVDIFVLDDGWEEAQGNWYPNSKRFAEGLKPIKERLDKYGIKLGLWYSPMGIDSTTQRYKDFQKWIIKDSEGNPILAQWNHPAFDFVSGFFDVFIADCKNMIDQGCRFMKWDAINTFYSALPNLEHGSDAYSDEEIRARYEYLLPIYVTKAMEVLTDYEPELVIEMDLTEARRVMVGLAPLSQGKLFWMNNGASWYNDYTSFRAKSMRTIANEFAGLIPLELFTYANYPQNESGNMKYNVHNSLLAGHGFWGNLQLMNAEERKWIGKQVELSKKVLPFITDVNPVVKGVVGDSPEIYSVVNSEKAAGQIIAFSEDSFSENIEVEINAEELLVALNIPFKVENDKINFQLQSSEKEASVAIFVLPNHNSGISFQSSTSAISDAEINGETLKYLVQQKGEQIIWWNKKKGKPAIEADKEIETLVDEMPEYYTIRINAKFANSAVQIQGSK